MLYNIKALIPLALGILFLASSGFAWALQWPAPPASQPFLCVYEGVFSQSGNEGTWEVSGTGDADSAVQIRVHDLAMVTPLVRQRIRVPEATVKSVEMTQKTTREGPIVRERTRMNVVVELPNGGTADLRVTVDDEQICQGTTTRAFGSQWDCTHTVTDGWTLVRQGQVVDSGDDVLSSKKTHHYLRNENFVLQEMNDSSDGESSTKERSVEAMVVETTDDKGQVERLWMDPNFSTCPLQVDRMAWKRVVGSDRLIRRKLGAKAASATPPVQDENRDAPTNDSTLWLVWILGSTLGVLVCIGWVIRRRRTRS